MAEHMLLRTVAVFLGLTAIAGANRILNNYVLGNPLLGGANTRDWPVDGWSKEIVLITGGSSGIGRLMVATFARRSIRVVILDLQAPTPGPDDADWDNVCYYAVDLTDADAVEAVAARVRAEVGDPTVVINNAGIGHGRTLLGSTAELIQRVFAVNAVAPLLVTRAFLPAMVRARHGHVVTVASMASFVTVANNVDYSCSKAAVLAFHEGLRQELRHRYDAAAVRTTIVHPFWVRTPLLAGLTALEGFRERLLEPADVAGRVVQQVLQGRSGSIVVPRWLGIVAAVRAFPAWLQETVRSSKAGALQAVADAEKKLQ